MKENDIVEEDHYGKQVKELFPTLTSFGYAFYLHILCLHTFTFPLILFLVHLLIIIFFLQTFVIYLDVVIRFWSPYQ
jgi:hypothetical protein